MVRAKVLYKRALDSFKEMSRWIWEIQHDEFHAFEHSLA